MSAATLLALAATAAVTVSGASTGRSASTVSFSSTGAPASWTVPAGVTRVRVVAEGGDGVHSFAPEDRARGAVVSTTLRFSPGDVLDIRVARAADGNIGGYNGGGSAAGADAFAGGGGGATDVRRGGSQLANRVVVAGGGGGARNSGTIGGSGGTPNATDGTGLAYGPSCTLGGGGGGTSVGGAEGVLTGSCPADFTNGSAGVLGSGADSPNEFASGGGGGYYGGGSGSGGTSGNGAPGGGGSSYVDPAAVGTTYSVKSDANQSDGALTITYDDPETVTFDANGGSGSMAAQIANESTALPGNAFTRSGYAFSGWNTAADGTGTSYADRGQFPFAAPATLYAQWTVAPAPDSPPAPGAAPPLTAPADSCEALAGVARVTCQGNATRSAALDTAARVRAQALEACDAVRDRSARTRCAATANATYSRTNTRANAIRARDIALARCEVRSGRAKALCTATARAAYARSISRASAAYAHARARAACTAKTGAARRQCLRGANAQRSYALSVARARYARSVANQRCLSKADAARAACRLDAAERYVAAVSRKP